MNSIYLLGYREFQDDVIVELTDVPDDLIKEINQLFSFKESMDNFDNIEMQSNGLILCELDSFISFTEIIKKLHPEVLPDFKYSYNSLFERVGSNPLIVKALLDNEEEAYIRFKEPTLFLSDYLSNLSYSFEDSKYRLPLFPKVLGREVVLASVVSHDQLPQQVIDFDKYIDLKVKDLIFPMRVEKSLFQVKESFLSPTFDSIVENFNKIHREVNSLEKEEYL